MQTLSPFHHHYLIASNIKLFNILRIFQSISLSPADKEQYIKNFAILKSAFQKSIPYRELTIENIETAFRQLFQSPRY